MIMIKPYREQNYLKTAGVVGAVLVLFLFLCAAPVLPRQSDSNTLVPPDSSFVMKVNRVNGEVMITLSFTPSCKFEWAAVEKRPDFDQAFGKCEYFEYSEVVKNGRLI